MAMLAINSVAIKDPSTFSWGLSDLSSEESGRSTNVGGDTTVKVPIVIGQDKITEAVLNGIKKRNRRFSTSVSFI